MQRARGDLRAGARHVHGNPGLRIPLAMMALVGTLSFNFQVLMPLLADTWHGTAATYALLTAAMAVGSVARRARRRARAGASRRGSSSAPRRRSAPSSWWPRPRRRSRSRRSRSSPSGAMTVTFSAGINSTIQLAVAPAMRGRVMALYSVVFLGSTPIGAPLVGWLAGVAGPRVGMALGATAALAAAALASAAYARTRGRQVAPAALAA